MDLLIDLKSRDRWCSWQYEQRTNANGETKTTKTPKDAKTGANASTTDRATWSSYDAATAAVQRFDFDGVGFMLGDGFAGIDLDHCFKTDGNGCKQLKDYAQDIVNAFDTYCELSPSGDGLHLLFTITETLPSFKNDTKHVEFYTGGRYLTFTGDVYGEPKPVTEQTASAQKLVDEYKQRKPTPTVDLLFAADTQTQPSQSLSPSAALDYIHARPLVYLQYDAKTKRQGVRRGIVSNSYVCPICNSGANNDGMTTTDGVHFKCWACAARADSDGVIYDDIVDIIGKVEHIKSFKKKLNRACEIYGIAVDWSKSDDEPKGDSQRDFFNECHKHLNETDYMTRRGISQKTCDRFCVGYCANWQSPKAVANGENPQPTARVIIPCSDTSYLARSVDDNAATPKLKHGEWSFFNIDTLKVKHTRPVFVVEGEIDAMSVIDWNLEAVALRGLRVKEFAEIANKQENILLIALDSDKDGIDAANTLDQLLTCEHYVVDINGKYKDANEHHVKDPASFRRALAAALDVKAAELRNYLQLTNGVRLKDFREGITDRVNTPAIATGFAQLDFSLDGGLYEGLYIVGAISSLGKTTFALQIASNVARQGHDVLIFSLEMAASELIAKDLSRITRTVAAFESDALTVRDILSRDTVSQLNDDQSNTLSQAFDEYATYANRIIIVEGLGDVSAQTVREAVAHHKRITGRTPVVFVDYVQMLTPYDVHMTDKQSTDRNVLELKRISRDYKTPVIGVSSFNRENYNQRATMSAYKESGAIEYGSDVLLALQLEGVGSDGFDVDQAKAQTPRHVECKILKNRNGLTGKLIAFDYDPRFNYFDEKSTVERSIATQDVLNYIEAQNGGSVLLVDICTNLQITKQQARDILKENGYRVTRGGFVEPIKGKDDRLRSQIMAAFYKVSQDGHAKLADMLGHCDCGRVSRLKRDILDLGCDLVIDGDFARLPQSTT